MRYFAKRTTLFQFRRRPQRYNGLDYPRVPHLGRIEGLSQAGRGFRLDGASGQPLVLDDNRLSAVARCEDVGASVAVAKTRHFGADYPTRVHGGQQVGNTTVDQLFTEAQLFAKARIRRVCDGHDLFPRREDGYSTLRWPARKIGRWSVVRKEATGETQGAQIDAWRWSRSAASSRSRGAASSRTDGCGEWPSRLGLHGATWRRTKRQRPARRRRGGAERRNRRLVRSG